MTSLLSPLVSIRSSIPLFAVVGTAPHFLVARSCLRICKWMLPQNYYENADRYMSLFYGDDLPIDVQENILYLSNHQSAADWMLAVMIGIRQNMHGRINFFIKDVLRYLPFYGAIFTMHGCIPVRRNGANKDEEIKNELRRFEREKNLGYYLTIFAEGTRFDARKCKVIEKSQKIAIEKGFRPFENVLFPRTKALELSLETLEKLDAIYDVTLAFKLPGIIASKEESAPSISEMVSVHGREIHLHFKRIPIDQVPKENEEIKTWLYARFEEKDKLLSHFYNEKTNGSFPGRPYKLPLTLPQTFPPVCFYTGVMILTLSTKSGRELYLKTLLFGTAIMVATPLLKNILNT